jgi:hypothetical protein
MKSNTYKVTGYFDGVVYALYKNEVLEMLLCELNNPLTVNDKPVGYDMFPLREVDLTDNEMLKAVLLKPKSVADKVALFTLKYKQHKGQPYRAMKEEKANLKNVTVNEALLDAYFKHVNYPLNGTKSMADYIRHYNTVRDLAANGVQAKNSFPMVYDKAYEKTISEDVAKLQRYWAHLRTLGWKKVDGAWTEPAKF